MKKTALIGLMTLSIGGVAQAQTVFTEVTDTSGDFLWNTAANWSAGVPTAGTDANITGLRDSGATAHAVIDATNYGTLGTAAVANDISLASGKNPLNTGGNLTVEAGAFLTANAILIAKTGLTRNNGTINLTQSVIMTSTDGNFVNNGAVELSAGNLNMQKSTTFTNNVGATFTGLTLNGTNATDGLNTVLSLHGGTMNFTDITFFDGVKTGYSIDFDGDGVLNLNIADGARRTAVEGFLTTAINDGDITYQGGAFNLANMTVDGTTITLAAVPEPGTYALLAGCFGLTWVMLRRRR